MPNNPWRIEIAHSPAHGSHIGQLPSLLRLGGLAVGFLCSIFPARSEYRLASGDVVEISVARVPELTRRVAVQLDGTISFAMLGTIAAAGLSPSELQSQIQVGLAAKVFRQRTSDGRENAVVIEAGEVTAVMAEYRPIYVNGDISKPGEYSYRPLMTARQAVAISGGYDTMHIRINNPIFESADLRGEYESLWTEFAKEQARVWRMKSELGDQDASDQKVLMDVPIPRATVSHIVNLEAEQLKMRQTDQLRQKAFLQRAIKQAADQIVVLSEEQRGEEQGASADQEDLRKLLDLYGKGLLPSTRLMDARRAVLLSTTRKLQTASQLMQLQRQEDDYSRQLEKLDDQRRIDLLRELQDATVKLSELRTKLQSTGEKLQYTIVRAQLARGSDTKPEIAVVRKSADGRERMIVGEDFELQPGDILEVALRMDDGVQLPTR